MNYDQLTAHYQQLAEQMLDEAFGDNRKQWILRVEAELPQIRRVFAWLKEQGDATRGLRLAYLLQELWFEEQHTAEGLSLIQDLMAIPAGDIPTALRASSLDLAGAFALALGDYELAASLKNEAIALLRTLDDKGQLGYALLHKGHLAGYAQGDYIEAESVYREALGIFTELDEEEGLAHATGNLGYVMLELGDDAAAQTLVVDALRRYSQLDSRWDLALTIGGAAAVAVAQGQFDRAVRLAAASAAHRERIGVSMPPAFEDRFKRIEAVAASGTLTEEQRAAAWEVGRAMSLSEAVDYALRINSI